MTTAHDAYTSGAHRGELDERELHVPGGATDPLWYFIADRLCPHMESTRKRGWIEGFVAALETIRGIDGEAGVATVLMDSISTNLDI